MAAQPIGPAFAGGGEFPQIEMERHGRKRFLCRAGSDPAALDPNSLSGC